MRASVVILVLRFFNVAFAGDADERVNTRDLTSISVGLRGATGLEISKRGYDFTALQFAAYYNLKDVVEWLLSRKEDVNETGNIGKKPLHAAVDREHIEVACLLISHGANVSARDCNRNTPIDLEKRTSASKAGSHVAVNSPIK